MISTAKDLLVEQLGQVTSLIFLLIMLWSTIVQIRSWVKDPNLISPNTNSRNAILILAGVSFIIILFFLMFIWKMQWWTLAVALALGFSSALIGLSSALAFLLALLLLRPFEISGADPIINSLPRAAVVVVVAMIISRALRERMLKVYWSRECTLLLIFTLWLLFTGTLSSDPVGSKSVFFDTVAKGAVLFWFIGNVLRNDFDIKLFKNILVSSAFGITLSAIFYNVVLMRAESTGRLSYIGLLGDPNDITAFAILALPFALSSLWSHQKNWFKQLFAITFLFSTCFMIYLAQSRGAI